MWAVFNNFTYVYNNSTYKLVLLVHLQKQTISHKHVRQYADGRGHGTKLKLNKTLNGTPTILILIDTKTIR